MSVKKVALYLRKSREEEHESREETLARHERMLRDFCKANNLEIVKVYKEVVSGENLDARPKARLMLDDVADKLYDGVVVVELERLSRGNQIDQVEILETFKKSDTKIYTLNKTYDLASDNEFDEEFFEFGLFMSRREYKIIKRRLIRGKKQAQKEGYFIGSSLPFGFNKIRGDRGYILVPNEDSQVVQMMYHKFVDENFSLANLRDYLNSNGFRPQRIDTWSSETIKKVLRNKCYVGYINYNSRTTRTQECYKGKHDAIIDEDTFEKAQAKLRLTSHKLKRSNALQNPLASLVKCSHCGATLQKKQQYFRCPTAHCPTVLSYIDDVEKRVIEELKMELKNFNYFIDNYGEEIEKQNKSREMELGLLRKEIDKKSKMINKACEMLELGVYTKEKYLERVNILEGDIKALKEQIKVLDASFNIEEAKIRKAIPILEKCLDAYWELNPQEKNDLLKSFIDHIEYSKSKRNNRWQNNLDDMQLKIYLKI